MALTYAEALAALDAALTFGIHPALDGIRALTERLGRPQDALACIQVTGTNGKTSTTRMVAALLASHGHRVGCYTSPHLQSYTERIEIDGRPVSEEDFALAIGTAVHAARDTAALADSRTEFELLTAAAMWLFRERACDWAVLEVGMGGRWDATSVVAPAVAVITGVGLDHTERLGSTVEEIAADKAHIIKPAASVVLGPGTACVADVFLARAEGFRLHPWFVAPEGAPSAVVEARTVRYSVGARAPWPDRTTRMHVDGAHGAYDIEMEAPSYQAPNAATAIAAVEASLGRGLDPIRVTAAFAGLRIPGRFELIGEHPPVVLDGAHNPQAARVMATAVAEAWPRPGDRPLVLLGMLADKDARGVVSALAPHVAGFVCTAPDSPRAMPAEDLAAVVADVTGVPCGTVPLSCVDAAWVSENATSGLLVTGSLYTVGRVRTTLR